MDNWNDYRLPHPRGSILQAVLLLRLQSMNITYELLNQNISEILIQEVWAGRRASVCISHKLLGEAIP